MKWATNIQVHYFILTYVSSQEVKYSSASKLLKIILKILFFQSMLVKHVSLNTNYGFAELHISLMLLMT